MSYGENNFIISFHSQNLTKSKNTSNILGSFPKKITYKLNMYDIFEIIRMKKKERALYIIIQRKAINESFSLLNFIIISLMVPI